MDGQGSFQSWHGTFLAMPTKSKGEGKGEDKGSEGQRSVVGTVVDVTPMP